jgi:hypothetical protein
MQGDGAGGSDGALPALPPEALGGEDAGGQISVTHWPFRMA